MAFHPAKSPERQFYQNPQSGLFISYRQNKNATVKTGKPTMVFLHGFNGSSLSWAYQFDHFTSTRLISIDAPGFGNTSVIRGGIKTFAKELLTMLAALNVQRFVIVGHSMGGMLGQVLAAKSGANCVGLILSCTHKGRGAKLSEPLSTEIQQRINQRSMLSDKDYGELRVGRMLSGKLSSEKHKFLASIAGEIRVEGIKWGGAAIQYIDTTPYLRRIHVPILVLTAKQDIVVSTAASDALITSLPSAQHVELKDVGHAPYCENASNFNKTIENFIKRKITS